MKITGARVVVECLIEQGVDTVFGYPGGAILNIYDELYKNSERIRHILTAHEQGASHAAWKPIPPKVTTGYLARYVKLVSSADKGAILE